MYLEALVVLFLVATFLAILLPHFGRARAVARRTQCLNNLKNIALALQNYSDVHNVYPPGYIVRAVSADDPAVVEQGPGWGWGTMSLPHLDQGPMYRTFDFRLDLPGNPTVISSLLCPDAQTTPFSVASTTAGLVTVSPSSFVGVAGLGSLTDQPGRPSGPGMFYRNSSTRMEEVEDGISNTLLVGERKSSFEKPDGRIIDTSSTWIGAVSGAFRDPGYDDGSFLEGPGSLVLGIVGQNRPVPLKIPLNGSPPGLGFSSPHEGGVHFSRVDGSCSLLSSEIDVDLYMRLGQRADGQPASWP
ncbi:hypothetical protein Pan44_09750 [Caulifigura coniformis]|uniref:DUF1559 domain-containing protein n=1 Tax=Caulifigura coniformis TaxID=2527983 RepID=A0A517SA17_9PLAN|nr:DUF1559 domain-containing protein [Caulifigura coniformis]QDT52961.1 hypothetical protein Pan44_09750 [Caulifigura coniformis]